MNYLHKYRKYKQKYLDLKRTNKLCNNQGKTLIFGNSHAGPFNLINNPNVNVHVFKGATAKGLTKHDNKNRVQIENIVSMASLDNPINCLIFVFGTVDVLMTPFYLLFAKNQQIDINDFTSEIVKGYIDFVQSFDANHIFVSEVMYSTLDDEYLIPAMKKYNSIIFNEITDLDEKRVFKLFGRSIRNSFVDSFNDNLRKYTKDTKIKILEINSRITKGDKVKSKYLDQIAKTNIHYIWEEMILDYIDLLKNFDCDCGINENYLSNLEKSKKAYVTEKQNRLMN